MKIIFTVSITLLAFLITGCSNKNESYYNAVKQQNENYMRSYDKVENESVQFDGEFKGKISIVKPKKLPQLQTIQRPKSGSEVALDWARVVVPVAGMAVGMHYNFKTADSNNKYNAQSIESYTGNFQNTSTTSTTDTSVTDTSVTDTSVTDTSVTNDTTNPVDYTDGTISITNP